MTIEKGMSPGGKPSGRAASLQSSGVRSGGELGSGKGQATGEEDGEQLYEATKLSLDDIRVQLEGLDMAEGDAMEWSGVAGQGLA